MIKVINLKKIYKMKKKKQCVALNNVSFLLPDTGLIFIVGKSGSGKSTLLNLLGGLDGCTSGKIFVDEYEVTSLHNDALTKYRNEHLSFIFQDYHVLDKLTVKENVSLSLEIAKTEDNEKIDNILQRLDILDLKDRYPKELSGGQKQRVAIARALVKDTKVILCDEPSGNLDKKTTVQLLHILKEISQTKLVVVVSHSLLDAQGYADRIIELSEGEIVRDRRRTQNYINEFRIENNTVYLPHYNDLEDDDLEELNKAILENDSLKFNQVNNRFLETKEIVTEEEIEAVLKEEKISKILLQRKKKLIKYEEKLVLKSKKVQIKKANQRYKLAINLKLSKDEGLNALIQELKNINIKLEENNSDKANKPASSSSFMNELEKTQMINNLYEENEKVYLKEQEIIKNKIWKYIVKEYPDISNTTFEEANKKEVKKKERLSKASRKKLYRIFFSRKVSTGFSVFLASLLLVCFAIFQSFLSFDGNKEISKTLTKYNINTLPLQKGVESDSVGLSLGYLQSVNDEEINAFYDAGYTGKIYGKYNCTLPINVSSSTIDNEGTINYSFNLSTFYVRETFGVINCDEALLISIFGKDGKITYLEQIDPELEKDYGIIIPDYVADSIIAMEKDKGKEYKDILGPFTFNKYKYGYINAIIDTDYETKYKDLIDQFNYCLEHPEDGSSILANLKETPLYNEFVTEAVNYLAYGYSLNPNFKEALVNYEYRGWFRINRFKMSISEENYATSTTSINLYDSETTKAYKGLTADQIIMSATTYNKFFGTNYTGKEEITPHKVTLTFYENHEYEGKIIYQKEFEVVKIISSGVNYINVAENLELTNMDIIRYGIVLDSHDKISEMVEVATKLNFIINSLDATRLSTINRLLTVFGEFFMFIEIFFLLIAVIFLVNIGIQSVKKNKYEIGVLKALGVNSFDIIKIFIKHSVVLTLCIAVVSNFGIYLGTMVANKMVISAFEIVLNVTITDLTLVSYIPSIVIQDLFNIAIISVISFVIPQILLFRIKPIEIIRARE